MRRTTTFLAALLVVLAVPAAAAAAPKVAVGIGATKAAGQQAFVEVVVKVPRDSNATAAVNGALARQGARPVNRASLGSKGFQVTGLYWPTELVTQKYNPAGEPGGLGSDLLSTSQAPWTAVPTSSFDFVDGGTTAQCPSLVRECPGRQYNDGENGVGWERLDPWTLGVTWWTTASPEADMALNTRTNWSAACTDGPNSFSARSVLIHEHGHVAGLDHSDDPASIMQASYSEAQCALGSDDEEGLTYLYPEQTATLSGTVSSSGAGVANATVSLRGTDFSATTDGNGDYAISGVPYPVTYDVDVSANGFSSDSTRLTVDQDPEDHDVILTASGAGGDGGDDGPGGSFCDRKPDHHRCN